jgi:Lrp/AsnC family transcriptional regulator, leucine-responsive regulatory protein
MTLDKKDRRILKELMRDSRQTTSAMSKRLNMPITTIHNRIMKLRKDKVILNYTINPDYEKLGTPIFAYIGVSVDYLAAGPKIKIKQSSVAKQLKKIEGILEVTIMTGGTDILVKAIAADIFSLNHIVTEKMRNVIGVDKTQTSIVLQEV